MGSRVAAFGHFLQRHKRALRNLQWLIVLVYAFLLIVPACLPLPDEKAHVFNNLTVVAQFAFWGIWWPFVLVSMPLLGRAWCGWLCPEGMLTEWASERGINKPIPKWIRWGGWPFVAFALTTIYGQLVSVYQYPLAVLLVLGGSTVGAMAIGYLYGREKRIWCRYMCPVNGVFNLLAKLAPWRFKVDEDAWRASHGKKVIPINCAPLVPLRHMQGAGACHMCGRCSGHRDAIELVARSPEEEVVKVEKGDGWQTALIVFGMMGLATGAFLWSSSPWLVALKQDIASWLIDRDIMWPLADNAPWWMLTHYPEVGDSFSWLDGALILAFIAAGAVVVGGGLWLALWLADRALPQRSAGSLNKLALGFIPAAGCGVFLGLTATTITLLKHEGMGTDWVNTVRFGLLALALAWSLRLVWRLSVQRGAGIIRSAAAQLVLAGGLLPFVAAWVYFFVIW
ncbi:4Fe-4S binding domain-containing protein [Andreprevotia lacus DSM 23236]|uniref:4Fe-4S binding domain-containing protein n=2 Tax=Andreprevotia TaxID=397275 RepID=A0A1W1XUB5_9NEIS|nr:4Fe-4S binding domain-containing protein [Andreprevotia lacus DSM 23236]